jgi:methyltransferase-like protein
MTSYDEVPYRSVAFPQTHPCRIGALAALMGLEPAAVGTSRILEIGCASGGNIIPMADQYPQARCLGIDLSSRQVSDGERIIGEARLSNIVLRACDVTQFEPEPGAFDYIICHGVFSWVEPRVQEQILKVCQLGLAPHGVALISYNALPGWHLRGVIRGIMKWRADQFESVTEKLAQSREMLNFVSGVLASDSSPYGTWIRSEVEAVSRAEDSYIFHEHLEDTNRPFYFTEFIQLAGQYQLKYVAEADFGSMSLDGFSDVVSAAIRSSTRSLIETEQLVDFLRQRMFRQTILAKSDAPLHRGKSVERAQTLWWSSNATPENAKPLTDPEPTVYRRGPSQLRTAEPIVRAAMDVLRDSWPCPMKFTELLVKAITLAEGRMAAVDSSQDSLVARRLAEILVKCLGTKMVDASWHPPSVTRDPNQAATPTQFLRGQATHGTFGTNRLHEQVPLDDLQRWTLLHLQSTLEVGPLLAQLVTDVKQNRIVTSLPDVSHQSNDQLAAKLEPHLRQTIQALLGHGLLAAQ